MTSQAPSLTHVQASVDGPVGRVMLDRPDKLNPLGTDVLESIVRAARWFDDQPEVRVVVVSGAGRAFSAGADIAGFAAAPDDGRTVRDRAQAGTAMADALEAMRAVTVARLHGHCIGGGVVLASACDLRVAADTTSFSIPEVDLGIPLAWGGLPRLVREIGAPTTRDLVMTCRRFDAAEAARLGLVQRVVPEDQLDAAVEALVAQLVDKPPLALRSTKRGIDAVTSVMVARERTWSDADVLAAALADPGFREAADRYLSRLGAREG